MTGTRVILAGLAAAWLVVPASVAVPRADAAPSDGGQQTLIDIVREATAKFRDPAEALAAGYAPFQGCVSGPEEGAMGLHLAKGSLFDGVLDPTTPEVLVYEPRHGRMHLVAVEYVTPAPAWHALHPDEQPDVAGHLLHFAPGPNRYGPEPFYELHVWAWKLNPNGAFADWNPRVSCADHVAHP